MGDRVFVTLSEGEEAVDAHQLLVIDDPAVAKDVAAVIARRLGVAVPLTRPTPARSVVPITRDGGER